MAKARETLPKDRSDPRRGARNLLKNRFLRDERGNMAVIFGLTMMPTLFMAAAAIDYTGASELQTALRRATDGTSLRLCQMSSTATVAQLRTAAEQSMAGMMGTTPYAIDEVSATASPRTVTIATSARYQTAIIKALGDSFSQVPVGTRVQCANPQQTLEIALVLDNTGSMASADSGGVSKINSLKTAATNFVKFIYATPKLSQAKVSVVPFAASVAVNPTTYRNATWLDQSGKASGHWSFVQGITSANSASYGMTSRLDFFAHMKKFNAAWDWTGCLESTGYPFNVQDGAPNPTYPNSYFVPMLSPDEAGNGGQLVHKDASGNSIKSINSYIDDSDTSGNCAATTNETTRSGRLCKYVTMTNAKTSNGSAAVGPNAFCTTRPLTRLTTDSTLVQNEIAAMKPSGNTNTHEGFIWGWRTLSPSSVFADGAAYNTPYNNKIIVLMTDGANTWTSNSYNALKSYYSAYGHFTNPDGSKPNAKLPSANANPASNAQARAAMDALTVEACKNAAAAPNNVQIYTIGFSVPADPIDQQGIDMLAKCAGAPERAFVANDANGLTAAFQSIADNIGILRLTN